MKNKLIEFIPKYNPVNVISTLSQVQNWGYEYTNIKKYIDVTKSRGGGVNVVVLDTGASPNHPDLKDNFKEYEDLTGQGDPFDHLGHGTHCQGIIGACQNDIGVIGIAPGCNLYSGKVLDNNGFSLPDYSWIIKGIEWAIEMKADIINMSLGSPMGVPDKMQKLISEAAQKGIIFVAASGNSKRQQIDFPGRMKEVISVAAMDKDGNLASYSNIGPGLDFIAPGSDIYSTYLNDGYALSTGTSMASPFLAGVCALMLSYHRNGEEHKTPINNYQDAIDHIKKFEKGQIIQLSSGHGIGVLDFGNPEMDIDVTMQQVDERLNRKPFYIRFYNFINNILKGIK
jgi:major intracellular serine protease